MPDTTRLASLLVHEESPGRTTLPGQMLGQRDCSLYPVARSKQNSGISKVIYSTHSRQYQLSQQATGLLPAVGMGVDVVRAPSWSHSTASWGWAAQTAMATGPPPNASVECWRTGLSHIVPFQFCHISVSWTVDFLSSSASAWSC